MTGEYYAGIDVGTSYIKAVVIDEQNEIKGSSTGRSGADLEASINSTFDEMLADAVLDKENIRYIVATGFGRRNVTFANDIKTEISCHAKGANFHFKETITLIDIGGQDTKIIKVDPHGKLINFKMNRKCAAGTGSFLEEIAHRLNIPMTEMNGLAKRSDKDAALGSFCTVFACSEILTRIRDGERVEDMVRSAFESVVKRVIEMDTLEGTLVMSGGVVTYNDVILDILERYVKREIMTPPIPQLTGAFGAALFAKKASFDRK